MSIINNEDMMVIKKLFGGMLLIPYFYIQSVYASDTEVRVTLPINRGCVMESPSIILMPNIEIELLTQVAVGTALPDEKHASFDMTAYCTSPEYTITIAPINVNVEDGCLLAKDGLRLCIVRENNIQTRFDLISEFGLSAQINRHGGDLQVIPFKIIPTRGNQLVESGSYDVSLMFIVDVL